MQVTANTNLLICNSRRKIYEVLKYTTSPVFEKLRLMPVMVPNEKSTRRRDIKYSKFNFRVFRHLEAGVRYYCQEARNIDPVAERQFQLYYFNTLSLSKKLQKRGFTVEQSEAMAEAFVDVLQSAFDYQGKNMVTKAQQEITVQQIMAHIAAVKKDMIILEKSEFSMLRSETEKQSLEIKQMKSTLKDEISKLKGHIALDINLEKGRSIEAHAKNETQLQILHKNIDTEVANLRTTFEQYRNDIFKYAGGTVLTCATVCLGVIRLWS